jgi:hypothetical protein
MSAHTPLIPNADDLVSKFIDLSSKKGGNLYVGNFLKLSSYNMKDIMPYINRKNSINHRNDNLKLNVIKNDMPMDYNDGLFEKKSYQSVKINSRNKSKGGIHLIVMQHGLQVLYCLP